MGIESYRTEMIIGLELIDYAPRLCTFSLAIGSGSVKTSSPGPILYIHHLLESSLGHCASLSNNLEEPI